MTRTHLHVVDAVGDYWDKYVNVGRRYNPSGLLAKLDLSTRPDITSRTSVGEDITMTMRYMEGFEEYPEQVRTPLALSIRQADESGYTVHDKRTGHFIVAVSDDAALLSWIKQHLTARTPKPAKRAKK